MLQRTPAHSHPWRLSLLQEEAESHRSWLSLCPRQLHAASASLRSLFPIPVLSPRCLRLRFLSFNQFSSQ